MVLIKIILLGGALGVATLNFYAARDHHACVSTGRLFQRVPSYVEVETLLLTAILVAAVSLATQPPAIDVSDQHATWTEVYQAFQPKVPRLTSPPMPRNGSGCTMKPRNFCSCVPSGEPLRGPHPADDRRQYLER